MSFWMATTFWQFSRICVSTCVQDGMSAQKLETTAKVPFLAVLQIPFLHPAKIAH